MKLVQLTLMVSLALASSACSTTQHTQTLTPTTSASIPARPNITDRVEQYDYADKLLGEAIRQGKISGRPAELEEALYWYELSANQNYPYAQFMTGTIYMEGTYNIPTDANKALYWFTKAAEQHLPMAQTTLGQAYLGGTDGKLHLDKDINKALYWLNSAAKLGHNEAQYLLGGLYNKGEHVTKNDKTAFDWYKKAATNNHAVAQAVYGTYYQYGVNVPEDVVIAYAWYSVAAANDTTSNTDKLKDTVSKERDKLGYTMTQKQLDAAQDLAQAYRNIVSK